MPILCKESLRVVCLCGGSGAELIALALSYNHSALKEMHVTVVDKEPLWHASSSPPSFLTSSLNRLFAAVKPLLSFSLSFEFIVADLLAPISFAATLQSASICTIVYGISELLDFDEAHSLAFLHSLRDLLPEDCLFMVVDPLSHQFCCEKEIAVKRAMMGNGSVQREEKRPKRVGWKLLYEGHDKVSVTRSILEPLIIKHCTSLNMQINRDIKLSCHTWCVLLRKEGPGDSIPPPLPSPHTTLLLTQFPCIENIVATLRPLHTNLWLPRDACDETTPTLSDRLLRAWTQNGGVLCLPYTVFKALAARRGPVECSLLVLHNYDCYAEGEKEETAHAVLESVVCDGKDGALYDLSALEQKDKYELFLGGNYGQCVITTGTENGKHLLLVKDSFANSFVPFLTGDYETITMIDLRYYRGSMAELAAEADNILVLTEVTNLAGSGDYFKLSK